jgi:beta-fructofuranosidase
MSESLEPPPPAPTLSDRWRPRYHVTGERNWINDPNGPIHHDGVYHLFYQANPREPFWGPPSWGHVSSTDLVTWTRHPYALSPEPGGPDADGCWSGCARVVEGRPAIYYTGVVGEDEARLESVCRAWGSGDLLHWEKDANNPLIAGPGGACVTGYHRDPFLWHDDEGWHMLLGSGTAVGPRHGQILRYDSSDATSWTHAGVFFEAPRWHGSLDLGAHWECPQLVIEDGAAALIISCQTPAGQRPLMHSVYFAGRLDRGRFVAEACELLDHGDVLYAPALCRDRRGRHLLWGWAQELLPAERQASLTHAGALTLPRQVSLDGTHLRVEPVSEVNDLRVAPLAEVEAGDTAFQGTSQMELLTTFAGSRGLATLSIAGARSAAPNVAITADLDHCRLDVTVADSKEATRSYSVPLPLRERHALQVFVDGSLLEVFADRESALTTRSYVDDHSAATVLFRASGDIATESVAAWALDASAIA